MADNRAEEIAFGFSRNLSGFKKVLPEAQNYSDLGLDPFLPGFADQLLFAMQNANCIHFDLSGMRFLNSPDGVLRGPKHHNPIGSTNWELRTIWDNPTLRQKTIFYRNGKVISQDAVINLH